MPIFEDQSDLEATPPPQGVVTKIEPIHFDGITIDTEYVPSSSLQLWIAGSNWTVNYYSQILGNDMELGPLQLDRPSTHQAYRLIKNLDLRVTQGLSFSYDAQTGVTTATGAGIGYPFLTPNKGDMFVGDIGDGRVGLFTITESTRSTILKDSVYNVEWTLVRELDQEHLDNLELKTMITLVYNRAQLLTGCGPFVTEEEEANLVELNKYFREMLARYLTDFLSMQRRTLLVPDQALATYDHFVVNMLAQILDTDMDSRIRQIREMNIIAEPVLEQPTLWDAIIHRNIQRLYGSTSKTHLVGTEMFRGRPTLQGLGYTGVKRIVFPKEAPTDIDAQYDGKLLRTMSGIPYAEGRPRRKPEGPYVPQADRGHTWFEPGVMGGSTPPWELPADIHPVVKDDYYVFSQAFYDDVPAEMSKLERITRQLIEGEEINRNMLMAILEHVYDWDNLERYYYYPVLFSVMMSLGVGI